MAPPTGNDGNSVRRSHLRIVTENPTPASETVGPKISSPPPPSHSTVPPSPGADFGIVSALPRLGRVIRGETIKTDHAPDKGINPAANSFASLQEKLILLFNPRPNGYQVSFEDGGRRFQLHQNGLGEPILLFASELDGQKKEIPGKKFRLTYYPDGTFSSAVYRTMGDFTENPSHPTMKPPERAYHGMLLDALFLPTNTMFRSAHIFESLHDLLTRLRSSAHHDQSPYYKNFVVHGGKIYSFEVQNGSIKDIHQTGSFHQIKIWENSGTSDDKILTLSATGEANHDPDRPIRQLPEVEKLRLIEEILIPALQKAREDPEKYGAQLKEAIRKLPRSDAANIFVPEIQKVISLPRGGARNQGPRGEPIYNIRKVSDLWNLIRPWASGHRWENPENHHEVRMIKPPWSLRRPLYRELFRWAGRNTWNFIKGTPRGKTGDTARLHINPDGSGQVTVWRKGELYQIVAVDSEKRVTNLNRIIREMEKQSRAFRRIPRGEKIQAAAQRINASDVYPLNVHLQDVPLIDPTKIHLGADGGPLIDPLGGEETRIRSASQAWELIRARFPEGLKYQATYLYEGKLVNHLLPTNPKVDQIYVDFFESRTPTRFLIRESELKVGNDTKIPKVDIIFNYQGQATRTAVFEDGKFVPGSSHTQLVATQNEILLGQRSYADRFKGGYYQFTFNGKVYAGAHFLSLPFIKGWEALYYTPEQQKVLGTPWPELSARGLTHAAGGFASMALVASWASLGVDGAVNYAYGIRDVYRIRSLGNTFATAYDRVKPQFLNPNPIVSPISNRWWAKGIRRMVPLFAGVTALELYENKGHMSWDRVGKNSLMIGGVSLASSMALQKIHNTPRLVDLGKKFWLLKDLGDGIRGARMGLTIGGFAAMTTAELVLLGIIDSVLREKGLAGTEDKFKHEVSQALHRRNEIISRLKNGETVPQRELVEADQTLAKSQAEYRAFLTIVNHRKGEGEFTPLRLDELRRHSHPSGEGRDYISIHLRKLADNLEDFDGQMKAYYEMSNPKMAKALEAVLPEDTVAMNAPVVTAQGEQVRGYENLPLD